jgi:hypothetical protein
LNLHGAIIQELFDYSSTEARVMVRRAGLTLALRLAAERSEKGAATRAARTGTPQEDTFRATLWTYFRALARWRGKAGRRGTR